MSVCASVPVCASSPVCVALCMSLCALWLWGLSTFETGCGSLYVGFELCVFVSVHVSLGGGHTCGRLCGSRFVFLGPFPTCMDIYEHLGETHGYLTVSLCGSVPAAYACM